MGVDDGSPDGFEDYYDLLGVEESVPRAAILAAYREQVQRHHPDVADRDGDSVAVARRMKQLSRARDTLANPARREAYDRLGHSEFVARQRGGETLTPGTTTARSPTDQAPGGETAVAAATVVEGDPETTLSDLVEADPLSVAWTWFRRCWGVRLLVAVTVGALVLTQRGDAVGLTGWLAIVLVVVAVTGGYAQRRVPTPGEPVAPPQGSSVGLFRPATARVARVRARRLLVVALVLAVTASPPWHVFDPARGGTWLSVSPLDTLLSTLLLLATVGGLLAALAGVSATAWLSVHGGSGWEWPALWDLWMAVAVGLSVVGFLAVTTPRGLHRSVALTDRSLLVAGLCLTLALVVLAGWRHGQAQAAQSTSTATS